MTLAWRSISPILPDDEYKSLKLCYLTPETGAKEIEPNIVYHDGKQIKFLLLPDAIPAAAYRRLDDALHLADWAKCDRAANGQKRGKKLTIGWYPQKPNYAKGSGYNNIRTAATLDQPGLVSALRPTLRAMDNAIETELPDYHDFAWRVSVSASRPQNEQDDLRRVQRLPKELTWPPPGDLNALGDDELNELYTTWRKTALPDPFATVEHLGEFNTYTLFGTVFSTVEINRNIVFKAHEDGHNALGTCVCITTLGSFVGGRLVFPRYGYSAELRPKDLLICDNNHELHGNLGPIVGKRFSVVAYLYGPLIGRSMYEEEQWEQESRVEQSYDL